MNRAGAFAYLQSEYLQLNVDAGLQDTQWVDAYNSAIDQSLRILGVDEAELLTTDISGGTSIMSYLALLDYFTLSRYVKVFASRFDVTVPGAISASRSQAYRAVMEMKREAEAKLAQLGIGVGGTPVLSMGRISLDFLEPDMEGGF